MPIETVRVTKKGRDQLLTLKRRTKIENWNILCRWAFCVSLAEPSSPRKEQVSGEFQVEMTWRTFGGEHSDIYMALLKERCLRDSLDLTDEVLSKQFRLHLHRGIGYLAGSPDVKDIVGLIKRADPKRKS